MQDGVAVNLITQRTADKDELFICPYDPVHRISAKRFVYHVGKCKKNHPHVRLFTCPFNARHMFSEPELRHHINTCPDKNILEIEHGRIEALDEQTKHWSPSNEHLDFGNDEDWDKESNPGHSIDIANNVAMHNNGPANTRRDAIKKMKDLLKAQRGRRMEDQDEMSRRPRTGDEGKARELEEAITVGRTDKTLPRSLLTTPRPLLAPSFSASTLATASNGKGPDLVQKESESSTCQTFDAVIPNRKKSMALPAWSSKPDWSAADAADWD